MSDTFSITLDADDSLLTSQTSDLVDRDANQVRLLTLLELGRVVVDVREGDPNLGGPRQPAHVTAHVFGLDDDVVLLPGLPVHVWQGGTDDT